MATVKTVKKAKARKGEAVAKRKAVPRKAMPVLSTPERVPLPMASAEDVLIRFAMESASEAVSVMEAKRFLAILKEGPLTVQDWASVLHVQERTMAERIKNKRDLKGLEADRVLVVKQFLERGKEVFGSREKFTRWLDHPLRVLGGRKPKEMLTSANGMGLVMAELGRIEHGVF